MSTPWPYPRWIAHRGAGKLAPENTLAAFRLGAAHGYRCFECDVKLSADGLPFLLHDATLERTSNGQGTAGEQAWSELSRLDAGSWHSRAYAGEPLPTLERLAAYLQANHFLVNLEIKPTPGAEAHTGQVVASEVVRLWRQGRADALPPPLLSSFRPEALHAAMQAAPSLPRALLLDTLWDGWQNVAKALQVQAIVTNFRLMDDALLGVARAEGWKALVYTVNEVADAQRLLGLPQGGIDGIITDAVDRFAPG
jgi:glycerophosphoryl diester phosphodiesterase